MKINENDVCHQCGKRWPPCHLILFGTDDDEGYPCCWECVPEEDRIITDPITMKSHIAKTPEPKNLYHRIRRWFGMEYLTMNNEWWCYVGPVPEFWRD